MNGSPTVAAGLVGEADNARPARMSTTATGPPTIRRTSRRHSPSSGNSDPSPSSDYKENLDTTQDPIKPLRNGTAAAMATPVETPATASNEVKARRHHTRSRGRKSSKSGTSTIRRMDSASSRRSADSIISSRDIQSTRSIDECARLLASIDERSHQRAILQDADGMLAGYIFPMSFPWNHNVAPFIKNMPRDIDEMPAILNMQDELHAPFEDHGTFGYGGFEVGKDRKVATGIMDEMVDPQSQELRAATRRSNDAGTIELTVLSKDPLPFPGLGRRLDAAVPETPERKKKKTGVDSSHSSPEHFASVLTPPSKRKHPNFDDVTDAPAVDVSPAHADNADRDEIQHPGELSYQSYRDEQASKKRKTELAQDKSQKLLISVRFGSVSSRSSLFDPHDEKHGRPILCRAVLPADVQCGKQVRAKEAKRIASQLGSYNCGHNAAAENGVKNQKKAEGDKQSVGRTRLLWTEAGSEGTGSTSRPTYVSLLTSDPVDDSMCRRPRELRVGIRLSGSLISDKTCHAPLSITESAPPESSARIPFSNSSSPPPPIYNAAAINAAVDAACGFLPPPTYNHSNKTCLLHPGRLLEHLKRRQQRTEARTIGPIKSFIPPQLDCLPINEGWIRVACTVPGRLKQMWVHELLNVAAQANGNHNNNACTVCWKDDGSTVENCLDCGVSAHLTCCWDRGERVLLGPGRSCWKCSRCSSNNNNSSMGPCTHTSTPTAGEEKNGEHSDPSSTAQGRRRATRLPTRYQSDFEVFRDGSSGGARQPVESSSPSSSAQMPSHDKQQQGPGCVLCPHFGGAMSPWNHPTNSQRQRQQGGWVHEVCRTWAGIDTTTTMTSNMSMPCAICGRHSTFHKEEEEKPSGLVKCAANGCLVHFHPMCALVATKLSERDYYNDTKTNGQDSTTGPTLLDDDPAEDLEQYRKEDIQLCRLYTLDMLECRHHHNADGSATATSSRRNHPTTIRTNLLPVAFCGIHNPQRERTFYGCDPGCVQVGGAMYLPLEEEP